MFRLEALELDEGRIDIQRDEYLPHRVHERLRAAHEERARRERFDLTTDEFACDPPTRSVPIIVGAGYQLQHAQITQARLQPLQLHFEDDVGACSHAVDQGSGRVERAIIDVPQDR